MEAPPPPPPSRAPRRSRSTPPATSSSPIPATISSAASTPSPGIISTVAGTPNTHGYSGDLGPATAATLNNPNGIAFDAAGNLYLADTANHAVRMISPAGIISSVAGRGFPAFSGRWRPRRFRRVSAPPGPSPPRPRAASTSQTRTTTASALSIPQAQSQRSSAPAKQPTGATTVPPPRPS